jgi:hypothetical protein
MFGTWTAGRLDDQPTPGVPLPDAFDIEGERAKVGGGSDPLACARVDETDDGSLKDDIRAGDRGFQRSLDAQRACGSWQAEKEEEHERYRETHGITCVALMMSRIAATLCAG